jgi:peptidyl-prolyl cis-trans isomerase SurA
MKRLFWAIFLASMLGIHAPAMAQQDDEPRMAGDSESIAAVVNGDAVTASDVNNRMRLIMASSGMPDTEEMRRKVRPQIVNMLIEETIIMQEAGKQSITVSDAEIQEAFSGLAAQNKFTPEQFHQVLAHSRVPEKAMMDQLRSQIAWTKVIQKKIRPEIEITDKQIDAKLKKLQDSVGTQEFLAAEIFLPVDNPQQEEQVKQFADRLTAQLSTGKVPFTALASQFSQSASATRGGDMGWMQDGQLPQEVGDVLKQMKPGELSRPVRSLTGYHILYLRQARQISADTMPSRDDIRQQIGMEQLDRMQRSYLLNLKTTAFIEHRTEG